jgi:outer membrane murein-binding lipoprotein Lpp
MKKPAQNSVTAVVFAAVIAASSLTACQSRPQLKQVASDAPEKAINTPEAADQLKKQNEK